MNKSVWIVLIASMLVGTGFEGNLWKKQDPKKEGGCGCGKPK